MKLNDVLLTGVALLMLTGVVLGVGLYLLFPERLELPELQPSLRVAREADFPAGTGRIVNWGEQTILVVRAGETTYFALQGVATSDGCILRWDAESLRVLSPCSNLVYDLHGNVVAGLTHEPLRRYSVLVRGGIVYIAS